jgi:hypothetical protein
MGGVPVVPVVQLETVQNLEHLHIRYLIPMSVQRYRNSDVFFGSMHVRVCGVRNVR